MASGPVKLAPSRRTSRRGWTGCPGRGGTGWSSSASARSGSSTASRSRSSARSRPADRGGLGLELTESQIGTAGAIYVPGACLGALFFGHLADRIGRKKLFMLTLVIYLCATVATAFSGSFLFFGLPLLHRRGHRRRVLGDQLRDRRADPRARARRRRPHDQRLVLARHGRRRAALDRPARHVALRGRRRLAAGLRARRVPGPRRSCSCAATSRRARAGCSSTATTRRPRRVRDIERQVSE